MSISVTGKLNKAAHQFDAGESKGFGVRIGVKFYNRETKSDEYTNYEAAVFARGDKQISFYSSVLVAGAVVEVKGTGCQIKTFQGDNGPVNSIAILDSKLGYVFAPETAAQSTAAPITEDIPF
jgi:single-strand DNA-binding protein